MCEGVMYQVDKKKGHVKSKTVFFSNKFMRSIHDFPRVTFHYLAFTKDGTLYLANNALPFDNDGVWKAQLPFDPLGDRE